MQSIITAILFTLLVSSAGGRGIPPVKEIIYVGTHPGAESQGLYVFSLDRGSGRMDLIQVVKNRRGPNFQALHPDRNYLYSVSHKAYSDSTEEGTVTSYRIDRQTGRLAEINERPAGGAGPAHVSVGPEGRFLYVSNFSSGKLSSFVINNDGSLDGPVDIEQHHGSSINRRRQSGPHVHSVIPSPDGRFVYASDMGTDKIMIYRVDRMSGELSPAEVPFVETVPGSGPRHFVIQRDGRYAYSLEQISSTIAVYRVTRSNGSLEKIQRVSMLPEGYRGDNQAADIHISPDGKFLYASNRGHNSIVIFKIDKSEGRLELVGHELTRGRHPRNFLMDSEGEFLLVANRDDDNLVLFDRDKRTGKLSYSGLQFRVPRPVCLTQLILQ